MHEFAPEDLVSVFRPLQAAGWNAILIGGQAVNVWACRYDRDEAPWRELRPYTSVDLDFHGGLAEARLAMQVLGAQGTLNTGLDPTPNAGVLKLSLSDGRELVVDILDVFSTATAATDPTGRAQAPAPPRSASIEELVGSNDFQEVIERRRIAGGYANACLASPCRSPVATPTQR